MRTFKVQISFGTDSDKHTSPLPSREKMYNIGISIIVIAAAAVALWRVV